MPALKLASDSSLGDALGIPPIEDAVEIEKRLPRETGEGKCQELEAENTPSRGWQ